jgi:CrcB protein
MSPLLLVGVAIGGAVGSTARLAAAHATAHHTFPTGTLVVNAAGSTLLGATIAAANAGALDGAWTTAIGAGLAGGLTTFSTMAVDAVRLWRTNMRPHATGYLVATLAVGLVGAWLGFAVTTTALS